MDRRFEIRKQEMLAECEVSPQVFAGVADRLSKFVQPFGDLLGESAQREHAVEYVSGLVSDLERKNVESIAYRHDQDRRNLQHFIGCAEWNHQPLLSELVRQVANEIGESDGVIVFDPSAFPKQGKKSVGVARQLPGVRQSDFERLRDLGSQTDWVLFLWWESDCLVRVWFGPGSDL